MFNDFKIRTYSNTPNKLRVLKDIFDRLNLFDFNKRLDVLMGKIEVLKNVKKAIEDNPPTTEFGFGEFLIVHAHNPEGKEIGGLVYLLDNLTRNLALSLNDAPKVYINGQFIGTTPTNRGEHNYPFKLSNYGILPGLHECTIIFNGISQSFIFNGSKNSITTITCDFDRIDMSLTYDYEQEYSALLSDYGTAWPGDGIKSYLPMYPFQPFLTIVGIAEPTDSILVNYNLNLNNFDYVETLNAEGKSVVPPGAFTMLRLISPFWPTLPFSVGMSSHPISINIPLQTEFTNWWCQGLQTGSYPSIYLLDYDVATQGWNWYDETDTFHHPLALNTRFLKPIKLYPTESEPDIGLLEDDIPKLSSLSFSANRNYKNLFFSPFSEFVSPAYQDLAGYQHLVVTNTLYSWNTPPLLHKELHGALLNDGLKISSVPYDLEGTSF